MRYNFISTAPMQSPKNLGKVVYETKNDKIKYSDEILGEGLGVQFPILQPMARVDFEKDAQVVFTTIIQEGDENSNHNYQVYCEEVHKIMKKKGISIDESNFKIIWISSVDSLNEQLKLFDDLIHSIFPDDNIYACLTYGNKPNISTLTMALEYAEKCINYTSLECLVYGRYPHYNEDRPAEIFDYSALIFMNSIINQLMQMNVTDIGSVVSELLPKEYNGGEE